MSEIFNSMSSRNKNIVNLFADRIKVIQCPLVTAMKLAKQHNVTLQFCTACVHANIGHASATVKWSDVKNEDEAVILAVEDCIDKFNKLTGRH